MNLHFRKLLWTSKPGPSSYLMGSSFMFTGRKRDSWNRKLHNVTSPKTSWLQCIMGHHLAAEADTTCTTWQETRRQPGINTHFKNQTLTALTTTTSQQHSLPKHIFHEHSKGRRRAKACMSGPNDRGRTGQRGQESPSNGAICRAAQSLESCWSVSAFMCTASQKSGHLIYCCFFIPRPQKLH